MPGVQSLIPFLRINPNPECSRVEQKDLVLISIKVARDRLSLHVDAT